MRIKCWGDAGFAGYAHVDDVDGRYLGRYRWNVIDGYAMRAGSHSMHRDVMERVVGRPLTRDDYVDHHDGDRLNNRRENLRLSTAVTNARNVARHADGAGAFKGVYPKRGRFYAQLMVDGRRLHLGTFDTEEEAARAYNRAAVEHHGEFARLNTIEENR
jgi:hypothetical protein